MWFLGVNQQNCHVKRSRCCCNNAMVSICQVIVITTCQVALITTHCIAMKGFTCSSFLWSSKPSIICKWFNQIDNKLVTDINRNQSFVSTKFYLILLWSFDFNGFTEPSCHPSNASALSISSSWNQNLNGCQVTSTTR